MNVHLSTTRDVAAREPFNLAIVHGCISRAMKPGGVDRSKLMCFVFAVDLCAYAIMSNHCPKNLRHALGTVALYLIELFNLAKCSIPGAAKFYIIYSISYILLLKYYNIY